MFVYVCVCIFMCVKVKMKVAQLCPTLCDPMHCSFIGSSVHGDSPGKNTGVGSHSFLHRVFSTQGSNLGLPHCRWILYHLSHQGSPCVCANIFECICVLCVWMFVSVYMCICEWVCMFYMYARMCVSMWLSERSRANVTSLPQRICTDSELCAINLEIPMHELYLGFRI